ADFLILNESIRHFTEGSLNHAFVLNQCELPLCRRQFNIRAQTACSKDRLRDLRHELPHSGRAGEETRQLAALGSEQTCQSDPRIIGCLGDAKDRIGRDERLLSASNVRTSLEQVRRQTWRYRRWLLLLGQRTASPDRAWILSDQETDLILRL